MPRNASEDRLGRRQYVWRGSEFWSVTTILSVLNKPWLVNWAKKFTAEYAVDNIDQLNEMLRPQGGEIIPPDPELIVPQLRALKELVEGEWDGASYRRARGHIDAVANAITPTGAKPDREGAVSWLKDASWRERDRAGDLGTAVHQAAEAYALGKPWPKWPLPVAQRMEAFKEFLSRYEPVYDLGMAESSVYNKTQRYAGTLDGIVTIDDKPYVIDYKTGKAIGSEVSLQLTAYRHAEFIGAPDGSEVAMPETVGAVCLHLPASGEWRLLEVRSDEDVFKAFVFIREAFRWNEFTSKTAIIGDLARFQQEALVVESEAS